MEKRGKFYLITGGARSGKSAYAEELAESYHLPVTYLATAQALDEEMKQRISKHRMRRPANWKTVEEPIRVAEKLEAYGDHAGVVLIDCLTMLISNLIYQVNSDPKADSKADDRKEDDEEVERRVVAEMEKLARVARDCRSAVILVSNEVGLGLVPAYHDGRLFRDLAGLANQMMAREADHVFILFSGLAVDLKELHHPVK